MMIKKWMCTNILMGIVSVLPTGRAFAETIKVSAQAENLVIAKGVDARPDKAGMVLTHEIELPEFERGVYYRPYSGGVARGNRVEAVAFQSITELEAYKPFKY